MSLIIDFLPNIIEKNKTNEDIWGQKILKNIRPNLKLDKWRIYM